MVGATTWRPTTRPSPVGTVVSVETSADSVVLTFTVTDSATCEEQTPKPDPLIPCSPGVGDCWRAVDNDTPSGTTTGAGQASEDDLGGCTVVGEASMVSVVPLLLFGLLVARRRIRRWLARTTRSHHEQQ